MITAREVTAADRGARHQILAIRSRNVLAAEDNDERLLHAKSLVVQGQLHHLADNYGVSLWADVVQALPPECMKCALNTA